jgi:diacylglycerol O-acyltransferase
VLGVDVPITGSPWLMAGLASLLGGSNFASRAPAAGNVTISNVPGPPMTLYMAGARMVHDYPVSIPYHGSALNITGQSYAGLLEFGLTAYRRVLSEEESYELVEHFRSALRDIEALPSVSMRTPPIRSQCWDRIDQTSLPRRTNSPPVHRQERTDRRGLKNFHGERTCIRLLQTSR